MPDRRGPLAGIRVVDAATLPAAYRDPDGYREAAVQASMLGYDGKWVIHPDDLLARAAMSERAPQ